MREKSETTFPNLADRVIRSLFEESIRGAVVWVTSEHLNGNHLLVCLVNNVYHIFSEQHVHPLKRLFFPINWLLSIQLSIDLPIDLLMNHNGYARNDFKSTHALSSIARRSWCTFSADFRSDLWASGVSGCPWLVALRIHSGPPYTFHTSENRNHGYWWWMAVDNKWQSVIILNDRWWPLSTHKNTKHLWQLITDKSHSKVQISIFVATLGQFFALT